MPESLGFWRLMRIRLTTSYIGSKPISKTASQKVKLLTANVRQIEEKRTAENNSPLDYSREGILTSFSGTLKLSANQLAHSDDAATSRSNIPSQQSTRFLWPPLALARHWQVHAGVLLADRDRANALQAHPSAP